MTECQGCGAWNDTSRTLCVLCGTPLAEIDEWDAAAELPPLPPLPDGGLSGPPLGPAARLITAANAHSAPVLAVDLPSGLDARTGAPYDPCIQANATLTLALPKTGLLAPAARPVIGELAMADIGIPAEVYDRIGVRVGPVFAERSIVRLPLPLHPLDVASPPERRGSP